LIFHGRLSTFCSFSIRSHAAGSQQTARAVTQIIKISMIALEGAEKLRESRVCASSRLRLFVSFARRAASVM
jgi:hypothetical protein